MLDSLLQRSVVAGLRGIVSNSSSESKGGEGGNCISLGDSCGLSELLDGAADESSDISGGFIVFGV